MNGGFPAAEPGASSRSSTRTDYLLNDRARTAGVVYFTGAGQSLDARRNVHGHPRQRAPLQLAFASVYPDPDVDTETLHGLSRRPGTFERARRGLEADEEPVAGRVDLDAFAPQDLGTHGIVMLREHSPPAAITQAPGMLGGTDDVGEEQRGENALHLARLASDASKNR